MTKRSKEFNDYIEAGLKYIRTEDPENDQELFRQGIAAVEKLTVDELIEANKILKEEAERLDAEDALEN